MPPADEVRARRVKLNLDTVEREDGVSTPYVVEVSGNEIVLTDARELDWQILADMSHPAQFLRHVMTEEEQEIFRKAKVPGWKLDLLMQGYMKHYGLENMPRGNGFGSRI